MYWHKGYEIDLTIVQATILDSMHEKEFLKLNIANTFSNNKTGPIGIEQKFSFNFQIA